LDRQARHQPGKLQEAVDAGGNGAAAVEERLKR
jgi:hypothetical protein